MTEYVRASCIGENALKEYIETYADREHQVDQQLHQGEALCL